MNSEQNNLDKFLDEALRSYADVAPRIGFESRVVANLRTAPAQPSWHGKLVYASAAIVVLSAVVYGVWGVSPAVVVRPQRVSPPPVVATRVPAPDLVRTSPRVVSPRPMRTRPVKQAQTRRIEGEHQHTVSASQLPAPMPLSQQEKLLLAFARGNPKELATTVAWQEKMREPAEQHDSSGRGEQQ